MSTSNRSAVVVIASDSRAIVEIELCLFDVLVYAQISYVRVQAPHFALPRLAPRARRVPLSPRREVAQRANNMSGRNRRTRMRKPFHYPSNWSLHAPAHTPPIQTTHVHTHRAGYSELMTVISFDKGYRFGCRVPGLVHATHPKPTSLSEILLQTNVNTIVNLTFAISAPHNAALAAYAAQYYPSLFLSLSLSLFGAADMSSDHN